VGNKEEEEEEAHLWTAALNSTESRAAVPRALSMVHGLVSSHTIRIHAGTDDRLGIYDEAQGFIYDNLRHPFNRGWAHWPLIGDIYGRKTMTPEC
jgi:hypothetical protein